MAETFHYELAKPVYQIVRDRRRWKVTYREGVLSRYVLDEKGAPRFFYSRERARVFIELHLKGEVAK